MLTSGEIDMQELAVEKEKEMYGPALLTGVISMVAGGGVWSLPDPPLPSLMDSAMSSTLDFVLALVDLLTRLP